MSTQKEFLRNFEVHGDGHPVDPNSFMLLPAMNIPGMRVRWAAENKVSQSVLLKVHGGLGDQICAEPTVRFAVETLKDVEISLLAMTPELYSHIPFKKVYEKGDYPNLGEHLIFDLFAQQDYFILNYIKHEHCHCVDFSCLVAFQGMVPQEFRQINLKPSEESFAKIEPHAGPDKVVVHCGKSWQSKTFPNWWWNRVLARLKEKSAVPILIGKSENPNSVTGMIEGIDIEGCIDLRDKLQIMETVALLQKSKVLLTNDSSPMHMAASGDAWIGFVTMARRPEFLTHTRHGQFGWRMENMSRDGIWSKKDVYLKAGHIEEIGDELRDSRLPTPEAFADWGIDRL